MCGICDAKLRILRRVRPHIDRAFAAAQLVSSAMHFLSIHAKYELVALENGDYPCSESERIADPPEATPTNEVN
jgi:hypothetical protein